MGDIPSKEISETTTDLPPSQPLPEHNSNPICQSIEPESIDPPGMAESSAETSLEPAVSTFDSSQELRDYEVRSKSIDWEEQNARAQLNAILKRKEEMQAAKKASILRRARQQNFRDSIDKSIVSELKARASVDNDLQKAIQVIAGGHTDQATLSTLKHCLIEQFVGTEAKDWVIIATKLLENKEAEEPKTPSIFQSSLSNGHAAQDICAHEASSTNENSTLQTALDNPSKELSFTVPENSKATVNDTIRLPKKREPPTSTDNDETTKLNSDGFAVNKELTLSQDKLPTSLGDKQAPKTPATKPTINSIPFIKSEHIDDHDLPTPPSAKRQKLTEIEKTKEPPQLSFSFNELSPRSVPGTSVPVSKRMPPPGSANDDVHAPSSPASVSRASVASSDIGSKRSRDEVTASSPSSTISINQTSEASTPSGTKKLPPAAKQFLQRIKDAVAKGETVADEMTCQDCGSVAEDPRLSACAHLYCSKCVSKIRKAATKADKIAQCIICDREIGKKCTVVTPEQVEEWKNEYAGDKDGDDDEDSNGGEGEGDEAADDNE